MPVARRVGPHQFGEIGRLSSVSATGTRRVIDIVKGCAKGSLNHHHRARTGRVKPSRTIIDYASRVVNAEAVAVSEACAGARVEAELFASLVAVVVPVDDEVNFLPDQQVEQRGLIRTILVASGNAVLVGGNNDPLYSRRPGTVNSVREPAVMCVARVVLPAAELVRA